MKSEKEQVRGCLERALVGKFGTKPAFSMIMLLMNYNPLNEKKRNHEQKMMSIKKERGRGTEKAREKKKGGGGVREGIRRKEEEAFFYRKMSPHLCK